MPKHSLRHATLLACGFSVLAITLAQPSCRTTPVTTASTESVRGPDTLETGNYTLVVHGMSCPKCISNVELQLARIRGVSKPMIDMKHGFVTITVTTASGTEPTKPQLASAIADAGFSLIEIRSGDPK